MRRKSIKSNLARLDRMTDAEIDYSDIPPLGKAFLTKATVPWPPAKKQLSIRLDADVLDWLKAQGRGYQTRINHILRAAMEGQPSRRRHPATASGVTGVAPHLQDSGTIEKAKPSAARESRRTARVCGRAREETTRGRP